MCTKHMLSKPRITNCAVLVVCIFWTLLTVRRRINSMHIEDVIYKELSSANQPLGVVSTINEDGSPASASVYYLYDKALSFYCITREGSRKYKNLKRDHRVSFVVTSEKPPKTIQCEGVAHEVTKPYEENEYFTDLVSLASKHTLLPPVSQIGGSKMVFLKITPSWIRVGNFEVMREGDTFREIKLT